MTDVVFCMKLCGRQRDCNCFVVYNGIHWYIWDNNTMVCFKVVFEIVSIENGKIPKLLGYVFLWTYPYTVAEQKSFFLFFNWGSSLDIFVCGLINDNDLSIMMKTCQKLSRHVSYYTTV